MHRVELRSRMSIFISYVNKLKGQSVGESFLRILNRVSNHIQSVEIRSVEIDCMRNIHDKYITDVNYSTAVTYIKLS